MFYSDGGRGNYCHNRQLYYVMAVNFTNQSVYIGLLDESQCAAGRHQCCCAGRLDCWKGELGKFIGTILIVLCCISFALKILITSSHLSVTRLSFLGYGPLLLTLAHSHALKNTSHSLTLD